MNAYCKLCGNEKVEKYGDVGPLCEKYVVNGRLAEARRRWVECADRNTRCCGHLNYRFGRDQDPAERERGHLSFHGKHWQGTHKTVYVEYGAAFYDDHARTYYVRDFDSTADSEYYGESIPYLDPNFWEKLEERLDKAPEAAWNAGLNSCDACGYHYFDEPCCPMGADAEVEDEDDEMLVTEHD
jgi:hypothetical protein